MSYFDYPSSNYNREQRMWDILMHEFDKMKSHIKELENERENHLKSLSKKDKKIKDLETELKCIIAIISSKSLKNTDANEDP